MADLKFNRIWASDQNWAYPTDSQAARGLSFLGTEEPTFDLHDAMFKELDLKDKWLYDQVRNACERFGQDVNVSIAGGARDTMANAITNALITQRKADEGGYGIVRMADYYQTREGKEYNMAVSPAHLKEYVADQNTWENTKYKPQTATRWPSFDEVTNKPIYGDIVWSSKKDFDPAGSASAVEGNLENAITNLIESLGSAAYTESKAYDSKGSAGSVQTNLESLSNALGNAAYCNVYDDGNPDNLTWNDNRLTTESTVKGVYQRLQHLVETLGSAAYTPSSSYDAAGTASAVQGNLENAINDLIGRLKSAAYTESSSYDPAGTASNLESRLNNRETVSLYGLKDLQDNIKNGEYVVAARRGPERYLTNTANEQLKTGDGHFLTGVHTASGGGIYGYFYRELKVNMQNGAWRSLASDE